MKLQASVPGTKNGGGRGGGNENLQSPGTRNNLAQFKLYQKHIFKNVQEALEN